MSSRAASSPKWDGTPHLTPWVPALPSRRTVRGGRPPGCPAFPADAPFSSSQASQRLVIQIRSAQSVPMSSLSERMNREPPPPGKATSLGGPSTGMRSAFTAPPGASRSCACRRAGCCLARAAPLGPEIRVAGTTRQDRGRLRVPAEAAAGRGVARRSLGRPRLRVIPPGLPAAWSGVRKDRCGPRFWDVHCWWTREAAGKVSVAFLGGLPVAGAERGGDLGPGRAAAAGGLDEDQLAALDLGGQAPDGGQRGKRRCGTGDAGAAGRAGNASQDLGGISGPRGVHLGWTRAQGLSLGPVPGWVTGLRRVARGRTAEERCFSSSLRRLSFSMVRTWMARA